MYKDPVESLSRCALCMSLALVLLQTAAHAYEANPGDRALPAAGHDLVSGKAFSTESIEGRWLLIDFWASWCGPCVEEFPRLQEIVEPYINDSKLSLVSISCDDPSSLAELRELISEHDVDYPVLYDGRGMLSVPAAEWGIEGLPSAFLISPDGRIASNNVHSLNIEWVLKYFLEDEGQVYGLRSWHTLHDDGSLTVYAEVWSPSRQPLELKLHRLWSQASWNPDDPLRTLTGEKSDADRDFAIASLQFNDASEIIHSFVIPADPNIHSLGYQFALELPGGVIPAQYTGLSVKSGDSQVYHRYRFEEGEWYLGDEIIVPD